MKQKILQLIQDKPRHFSKIIKNTSELMQWVTDNTKIKSANIAEMIYSALYQQSNHCEHGNIKKFNSINEGFRFCGPAAKCVCAAKSVSEKVKLAKDRCTDIEKQQIAERRKQTTLEKYGVINVGQTAQAKEQRKRYYQQLERKVRHPKLTPYQRLDKKYKESAGVGFVTLEKDYNGVSHQTYYRFICLTCHNMFDDYIDNGHIPKCKICHPYVPTYTSKQETEIFDYVKNLVDVPVLQSDKSIINPFELDIVIPDLKIAIEYCGLYWHSEAHKSDKNYHINKMNLCRKKGYRLITIFEDEWTEKTNIVKSRLKSILNQDQRIYARKCDVSPISYKSAETFLSEHHIQGPAISKIAYGCFHKGKLVAVMTFGKPRYDKKSQYELIRYCSTGTVVGGAGKLFSAFCKDYNPQTVISYCDMRWGTGNLYKQLNFVQTGNGQIPGYCYTDFVKRYHRSSYVKKKISNTENNDKPEYQIMRDRNMYRIWDCGQTKWQYSQDNSKKR